MAVPSVITDLNVVAASNSPAGADSVASNTGPDEYFRALSAIIKREQSQGTATASAATIDLGAIATGSYLHITGTTGPITSFGTVAAGVERTLVFDSTPTITHNATSMILLGGASRTLAAGDISVFRSEGSGNWREVAYQPANGSGGVFLQSGAGAAVTTVRTALATLFKEYVFRGAWTTGVSYSVKDVVTQAGVAYECTSAHVAGASLTTVSGNPWMVFIGSRVGANTDAGAACFPVHATFTTINRHAFEDYSHLATTDTGLGYASFDAKPQMENTLAQDHLVGFQSRPIFAGSATLSRLSAADTYWTSDAAATGNITIAHGYYVRSAHNGSGTVADLVGIKIDDDIGTGTIQTNTALLIENRTRGTVNYGIYQAAGASCKNNFGAGTHLFAGTIQFTDTSAGLSFGNDNAGKTISYGFGSNGQTQFGVHDFYDGKSGKKLSISTTRIECLTAIKLASYTFATLPAGSEGDVVWCSNGRKSGEAAGLGTGIPVFYSSTGGWCSFRTDATVTA